MFSVTLPKWLLVSLFDTLAVFLVSLYVTLFLFLSVLSQDMSLRGLGTVGVCQSHTSVPCVWWGVQNFLNGPNEECCH